MARISQPAQGSPSASDRPTSLDHLLRSPDRSFALLHRPGVSPDRVDVLTGDVVELKRVADIPLGDAPTGAPRHDVLALLPYRQIEERGFDCRDDGAPVIAMTVAEQATMSVGEVMAALPDRPIVVRDVGFDIDDDGYARLTRAVIADEIGAGAGANFVIHRSLNATIGDYSPAVAGTVFRQLLAAEQGAYWTFLVHTPARTFVGATPERHVSLAAGTATMNPISGTYRYPPAGPSLDGILDFLGDHKETDELYMVVDEELKMMASVCEHGGRVIGPFLKEMGRLAHTEYLLEGTSRLDVRDILRATMFAPTVTGSPVENACRVIARYEPAGRGYYSGVIALIGRDAAGERTLDSSILIRSAEIDAAGRLRLGVGATLVRHSDPASEVAETTAKAAALLAAVGVRGHGPARERPSVRPESFGGHPEVRDALSRRNEGLARFWFEPVDLRRRADPVLAGRRVLVVDAEDTFTWMLAHQLAALGGDVTVRPYHDVDRPADLTAGADLVVLGPGPGDPLDDASPRIAALRRFTGWLLDGRTPFLSICLSHQVLASALGFPLVRLDRPSQGEQREIDLFGRRRRVGFYNTFVASAVRKPVDVPGREAAVTTSEEAGQVRALRGPGFASAQFHPESILTEDGPDILADLAGWALAGTARDGR